MGSNGLVREVLGILESVERIAFQFGLQSDCRTERGWGKELVGEFRGLRRSTVADHYCQSKAAALVRGGLS